MSRYTNTPSLPHLCLSVGEALLFSPFVHEYFGCGNEMTVTREDARGLYPDLNPSNAAEVVLEQRGWMYGESGRSIFCSECAGGAGSSH